MKDAKIRHGIYKNLPTNTIYNLQAGAIVFTTGLAFKVSAAPGVISERYGSSTLWAYLCLAAVELILTAVIFALARMRADDLLTLTNSKAYKLLMAISSAWLTLKGLFYFSYCVTYLTHELFGGVEPALVYLLFLAPIVYLGAKGIRPIARTMEICAPVLFVLIVFNLIFLKTDMDFGRNLPVFSLPEKDFFAGLPRYGLWLADAFPLIFVRIKNKRLPYASGGVAVTAALVLVIVMLGVSVYGEALKTVSDLLVRIAGFNLLTLEIGRMEWTNLFGVVSMSILSLSFIYYGANAACERAMKNAALSKILFPLVIGAIAIFVPSSNSVSDFSTENMGYALFALAIFLPLATLAVFLYAKRKYPRLYASMDAEYAPYPPRGTSRPDSLADNVMTSYKLSAKENMQTNFNGELKGGSDA